MRFGQFSRNGVNYGAALAVAKPKNNDYGSVIPSVLKDPSMALTDEQIQDLTQRIQDLYSLYKGERDMGPWS